MNPAHTLGRKAFEGRLSNALNTSTVVEISGQRVTLQK